MSLSALARYSDAEDEIKDEDHDLIIKKESPAKPKPVEVEPSPPFAKPKALVSYMGDEDESFTSDDDEEPEDSVSSASPSVVNLGLFEGGNSLISIGSASPNSMTDVADNLSRKIQNDVVKLPPEVEGRCSKSLQEKIAKMIEKKNRGMNVNEYVQRKKEFRNPSIYEKLVSYIGIDEHGTNFPKHIYDPSVWGSESHYDNLAKLQKEHHDKKEREKLKRTQVEFVKKTINPAVSAAATTAPTEKKSKWDQKVDVK